MKTFLIPSLPLLLGVAFAHLPFAAVAEEVNESSLRPGLEVTEYPRDAAQRDEDHLYVARELLKKPIGDQRVAESLAPWTWSPERNAVASGFLMIPVDGDYRFSTKSFYDRNALLIDGKVVCLYRDGEETVETIPLKQGWARIESVGFAASGGDSGITVRWQPPSQKELQPIAPRLLYHEQKGPPTYFKKGAPTLLNIEGPGGNIFNPSSGLLASEVITVADDFVVEAYKNGVRIPDGQRKLLEDVFGAEVERLDVKVQPGDWLVFHVVNNHLRWGGSKYFAVAGRLGLDGFGFVSDPASEAWSVCDDPGRVREFIRTREEGTEIRAGAIAKPWEGGDPQMRKHAGEGFPGKALWGGGSSTWIKYVAPRNAVKPAALPSKAKVPVRKTDDAAPVPEVTDKEKGKVRVTNEAELKVVVQVPAPKPAAPKVPVSPTHWPVQILSAIYGTGGKNADVTVKVKDYVESKRVAFSANPPSLGADPNPYWNKSLWVLYIKDGVRREMRWNENGTVLPETFYGPQDAPELAKWLPATRWRGESGELQFHADHSVTGAGVEGAPLWEALANNKIRIAWSAERKVEYDFDYTWSTFHESGNAKVVFHVVE